MDEINQIVKERAVALYKFTKELNAMKQKTVLNVNSYPWHKALRDFPTDEKNILIHYPDRVENPNENDSYPLISVHKPEFERCPEPEPVLLDWLKPGWDSFRQDVKIIEQKVYDENGKEINDWSPKDNIQIGEQLTLLTEEEAGEKAVVSTSEVSIVLFEDDEERTASYKSWKKKRAAWVEKQKTIDATRKLFSELYQQYIDLQREPETLELIAANGFIRDKDILSFPEMNCINQAVLTHRLLMKYDASQNTIIIEDTDADSDLYSVLFQEMPDLNTNQLGKLREKLMQYNYHPFDRNETPDYLKEMIHYFSSDSLFCNDEPPENWAKEHRFLMYINPTLITRKRNDGTLKAIDQILANIEETGFVPKPICDIVYAGKVDIPEEPIEKSIDEKLAEVGGESQEILLCKEANREQLEIAKRIEQYNAVVVQGPPGTGKTHTIANLTGHFLAQGKSVLITSHTTKALSVLKDKIAKELQNLCVSLLDDTNTDMEKSVDGISDFISRNNINQLREKRDRSKAERNQIIRELADTRKKLFSCINQEYQSIILNGEGITPLEAAEFITANSTLSEIIPGKVKMYSPLPLSFQELNELYNSNVSLTAEEEEELDKDLPHPEQVLTPEMFESVCGRLEESNNLLKQIEEDHEWHIENHLSPSKVVFSTQRNTFSVVCQTEEDINALLSYLNEFREAEGWMIQAAVDGKRGGQYRERWESLIEQIQRTCAYADSIVKEQFAKIITFPAQQDYLSYSEEYSQARNIFSDGKKIGLLTPNKKRITEALSAVLIDGHTISSPEECDIVLHMIELAGLKDQCAKYWDALLSAHGIPSFYELNDSEPERTAENWIKIIQRYLNWYQEDYAKLQHLLEKNHIPEDVFALSPMDSEIDSTKKILTGVDKILPVICQALQAVLIIRNSRTIMKGTETILSDGKRASSNVCKKMLKAAVDCDPAEYRSSYNFYLNLYQKYVLQARRGKMLADLKPYAPEWASAIEKREGIHGQPSVPHNIEEAWKWKQLNSILSDMNSQSYDMLQKKSVALGKEYRKKTAEYAEYSAWFHLLEKTSTDTSMQQALTGWKEAVRKIGRGTGNKMRIAALRNTARRNMVICQTAVPAWIMPINKALESFTPGKNVFDIVIIDEASQSDLASLAILYMGKKLIIVGDDKQVSPMAIGTDTEKMLSLQQEYIVDKIPNAELYDGKRSIYDVAASTFQPLMLQEHFRCVPEIIGFSNMLSYDYKIKPLREASSSNLLPAVVNYRVDGMRKGKTNEKEAASIVALIQACIEQPEYQDKTFGVISMLGDEQAKKIQARLINNLDPKEMQNRRIICGNSANFQGDERDVIFLSLVDSKDDKGPLKLSSYGSDDYNRKRYNVAVSRARDQLWVVDSLDAGNDLQPKDLRKKLIDYSINPSSYAVKLNQIENASESPFEEAVAKALTARGYHLVQQWPVGAYRLDMVVISGRKKIVIECDGERWHSGPDKIREDMERQTILERIGWTFIRIRGSEYFRYPEKTIDHVVQQLDEYEIVPEDGTETTENSRTSELLERVKRRAAVLLSETEEDTINTPEPFPIEPNPIDPDPTKPEPDDPFPIEPNPIEPEPTKPEPDDPFPIEPKPIEPEPDKPEPDDPFPIEPNPIEPEPTKPEPDDSFPIEPKPIEPEPTKPEPDDPFPIEPKPIEPEPDKPEPDDPFPIEPEPTVSEPEKTDPVKPTLGIEESTVIVEPNPIDVSVEDSKNSIEETEEPDNSLKEANTGPDDNPLMEARSLFSNGLEKVEPQITLFDSQTPETDSNYLPTNKEDNRYVERTENRQEEKPENKKRNIFEEMLNNPANKPGGGKNSKKPKSQQLNAEGKNPFEALLQQNKKGRK